MFESPLGGPEKRAGTKVLPRDDEADTRHAATVEKLQASFEGRAAIHLEKGAIRVRVSNIRSAEIGTILADIEETPTIGFPIWIRGGGPRPRSHPSRWTIETSLKQHFSSDSWSSPPNVSSKNSQNKNGAPCERPASGLVPRITTGTFSPRVLRVFVFESRRSRLVHLYGRDRMKSSRKTFQTIAIVEHSAASSEERLARNAARQPQFTD
jgi:hypothetical protein